MTTDETRARAKAEAFDEAAAHLEKLAELADGPNRDVIALALNPTAYTFRARAERERRSMCSCSSVQSSPALHAPGCGYGTELDDPEEN